MCARVQELKVNYINQICNEMTNKFARGGKEIYFCFAHDNDDFRKLEGGGNFRRMCFNITTNFFFFEIIYQNLFIFDFLFTCLFIGLSKFWYIF